MSRTPKLGLAALTVALLCAPALALGATQHAVSNSTVFQDSIGEDALAPDITSTTVANDDTSKLSFQLGISNRPALTNDMLILILIDSDQNPATGDPQALAPGSDYLIELVAGEVDLLHWNGTDFELATAPTLTFSYPTTGPIINLSLSDLGRPKAFNFAVVAVSGIATDAQGNPDFTNIHRDASPDPGHGAFTYQATVKVTLSVVAFTVSPKPVKAGKAITVSLAVNESDTGAGVEQGQIACSAKIAGKRVQLRNSRLVNGIAVCTWPLPRTAKNKRMAGSIALDTQGAHVSRAFNFKVT